MSVRAGATSGTVRARRAVITTCLANAIEWYDFAIYGALASVLAIVLLSPRAESGALTVIFAVFSTSFLARPLGSLLIGVHADRFGRQRALAAMILLMAAATAAIGLLPPWSAIGVAAPACLVILRIVQGFSSGGEISTSIAFLVESARPGRWGSYTGWHLASVGFGIAGGLAAAAALSGVLATDDLERWGWRIPFLIAVPLGPDRPRDPSAPRRDARVLSSGQRLEPHHASEGVAWLRSRSPDRVRPRRDSGWDVQHLVRVLACAPCR
jgi:MFS transporter, MHS family, proline/betaine transporter